MEVVQTSHLRQINEEMEWKIRIQRLAGTSFLKEGCSQKYHKMDCQGMTLQRDEYEEAAEEMTSELVIKTP